MTLVVETGAATLASANTYYSLASADAYFDARGVSAWVDGDDDTKEYSLIKACSFFETLPWIGLKSLSTQALEWPRRNVIDKNGYYVSATGIPLKIKQAQAELAYRYFTGGNPAPDLTFSGGNVVRERVDVIEIEYDRGGKKDVPEYLYIDYLLKPFLKGGINVELVRA